MPDLALFLEEVAQTRVPPFKREPERGLEEAAVVQNRAGAAAFHESWRSQHLGVSGSQF